MSCPLGAILLKRERVREGEGCFITKYRTELERTLGGKNKSKFKSFKALSKCLKYFFKKILKISKRSKQLFYKDKTFSAVVILPLRAGQHRDNCRVNVTMNLKGKNIFACCLVTLYVVATPFFTRKP